MTTINCAQKRSRKTSDSGEGPQIHADKREDVVSGQDDVDDLLSWVLRSTFDELRRR